MKKITRFLKIGILMFLVLSPSTLLTGCRLIGGGGGFAGGGLGGTGGGGGGGGG